MTDPEIIDAELVDTGTLPAMPRADVAIIEYLPPLIDFMFRQVLKARGKKQAEHIERAIAVAERLFPHLHEQPGKSRSFVCDRLSDALGGVEPTVWPQAPWRDVVEGSGELITPRHLPTRQQQRDEAMVETNQYPHLEKLFRP